jgi:hypothetical protein
MFEHLGYFKEYYIGNKFIGTTPCEKDRDKIGYYGQRKEIISEQIMLDNGKQIKSGTEVKTMIYPLCGKITSQQ